jgi:hypothetical protein
MSVDLLIGTDSCDMLEGRDALGYVIGAHLTPSRQRVTQWVETASGLRVEQRDERGYVVTAAPPPRPIFRILEAGEVRWEPGRTLESAVGIVAARARAWGASAWGSRVVGDQRDRASLGGYFSQHSLRFIPYSWSQSSKEEAIATLRRMVRDRTLSITPDAEQLRKEMLGLRFNATQGGHLSYRTTGKDVVSALISIAHFMNDPDAAGLSDVSARPLAGTPYRANPGQKYVINEQGIGSWA